MFVENYNMWPYSFYMAVICDETATQKSLILSYCTFSIFPALEIKKIVLVGKIL